MTQSLHIYFQGIYSYLVIIIFEYPFKSSVFLHYNFVSNLTYEKNCFTDDLLHSICVDEANNLLQQIFVVTLCHIC